MYTTAGRWTTKGLDCCGHEHDTRDEAQKCLLQHQNDMRKAGKLSSREIVEVESLDELYDNQPL